MPVVPLPQTALVALHIRAAVPPPSLICPFPEASTPKTTVVDDPGTNACVDQVNAICEASLGSFTPNFWVMVVVPDVFSLMCDCEVIEVALPPNPTTPTACPETVPLPLLAKALSVAIPFQMHSTGVEPPPTEQSVDEMPSLMAKSLPAGNAVAVIRVCAMVSADKPSALNKAVVSMPRVLST